MLRSGRIDTLIELPMPDRAARKAIFAIHLRHRPVASNVSLDTLAKRTIDFSGADIENACRRAANLALSEWLRARGAGGVSALPGALASANFPEIQMRHFEAAFN